MCINVVDIRLDNCSRRRCSDRRRSTRRTEAPFRRCRRAGHSERWPPSSGWPCSKRHRRLGKASAAPRADPSSRPSEPIREAFLHWTVNNRTEATNWTNQKCRPRVGLFIEKTARMKVWRHCSTFIVEHPWRTTRDIVLEWMTSIRPLKVEWLDLRAAN